MHLQIIPLDVTAADRWFYFPMIGLLGMILTLINATTITKYLKYVFSLLSIAILLFLGLKTIDRNTYWHDSSTFFKQEIALDPSKENIFDIQYNYGTALLQDSQYVEASTHLEKTSQLSPTSYQIWQNLGLAYISMHKYDKAKYAYIKAIKLEPNIVEFHRGLIYIAMKQEKYMDAKTLAEKDINKWPTDYNMWRLLGLSAYKTGDKTLAQSSLEKSLALKPDVVTDEYLQEVNQNSPIDLSNF